jgi:hypothetical protein
MQFARSSQREPHTPKHYQSHDEITNITSGITA